MLSTSYFSIGLQGVTGDTKDTFKRTILDVLRNVDKTTFAKEKIDATLHKFELAEKHVSSNFGLNLGQHAMSYFTHEIDAKLIFAFKKHVERLRGKLAEDADHFLRMIERHLLNNDKFTVTTTKTDENYCKSLDQKEERLVSKIPLDKVEKMQKDLASRETENDDSLPSLSAREDIDPLPEKFNAQFFEISPDVSLVASEQPTNGLCYFTAGFDTENVPLELKPFLPLYSVCLAEFGARDMDCYEFSHFIDTFTGGISSGCETNQSLANTGEFGDLFTISSNALYKNIDRMIEIFRKLVFEVDFSDTEKLTILLKQFLSDKNQSLMANALNYASLTSRSSLTKDSERNEMYSGLKQLQMLSKLSKLFATDPKPILSALNQIASIFRKNGFSRAFVSGEKKSISRLKTALSGNPNFSPNFSEFPETKEKKNFHDFPLSIDLVKKFFAVDSGLRKTFIGLPLQNNFICLSIQTVPFLHEDYPALKVLSYLMQWNFLHKRIREEGNAYGSGASQAKSVFSFYSHSDPHCARTLQVFADCIRWAAAKGSFGDKDVEAALLTTFSASERPLSPCSKDYAVFSTGLSDENRLAVRRKLLGASADDLRAAAEKYLLPFADWAASKKSTGLPGVLGRKASLAVAGKKELRGELEWTEIL